MKASCVSVIVIVLYSNWPYLHNVHFCVGLSTRRILHMLVFHLYEFVVLNLVLLFFYDIG